MPNSVTYDLSFAYDNHTTTHTHRYHELNEETGEIAEHYLMGKIYLKKTIVGVDPPQNVSIRITIEKAEDVRNTG